MSSAFDPSISDIDPLTPDFDLFTSMRESIGINTVKILKDEADLAENQFEIIKQYVLDFQESLDAEHDVGLMLTHFGNTILMEVTHISYEMPVLMVFRGYVNGRKSTLIQHISQINFLLTSISKDPDKPHRKIGFTVEKTDSP